MRLPLPPSLPIPDDSWRTLLQRPPLSFDRGKTTDTLRGKRILITGAGGWIGGAVSRSLAAFAPEHLVLLDAAERNLYEIDRELSEGQPSIRKAAILGSVTQAALLGELFHRYQPNIIYHAAAFKHVPLGEHNPFAMIENNVIGTNHLLQAARRSGAEQCILLSTDKAADPVSIMGASKRIAELIMLANQTPRMQTRAVRLGNVLGSEGSVVPVFCDQIQKGGAVTVTHPDVRRYFLTTEDAVVLLLQAALPETSQGILVPELGEPILLKSLARHLIALLRPSAADVPITFTELRPGDKICETLLSSNESYAEANASESLRALNTPALSVEALNHLLQQLEQACNQRSLKLLLEAVQSAVPTYQPSQQITSALAQP